MKNVLEKDLTRVGRFKHSDQLKNAIMHLMKKYNISRYRGDERLIHLYQSYVYVSNKDFDNRARFEDWRDLYKKIINKVDELNKED